MRDRDEILQEVIDRLKDRPDLFKWFLWELVMDRYEFHYTKVSASETTSSPVDSYILAGYRDKYINQTHS